MPDVVHFSHNLELKNKLKVLLTWQKNFQIARLKFSIQHERRLMNIDSTLCGQIKPHEPEFDGVQP